MQTLQKKGGVWFGLLIVAIVLGASLTVASLVQLSVVDAVTQCHIQVKDKSTGHPIPGASVSLDFLEWPDSQGDVDYSITTGMDGWGERGVFRGRYLIKVSKTGYVDYVTPSSILFSTPETYLYYELDPDTGGGAGGDSGRTVIIHVLGAGNIPTQNAKAWLGGVEYAADQAGDIKIPNLSPGSYPVIIKAWRYVSMFQTEETEIRGTVVVVSSPLNTPVEYVALVAERTLKAGSQNDYPPGPWWDQFMAWLMDLMGSLWWLWLLLLGLSLLAIFVFLLRARSYLFF